MRFTETKVAGAYLIEPEPIADERGFFARTWCREEFADHGLNPDLAQANISFNHRRGTLRGLHYQVPSWSAAPGGRSGTWPSTCALARPPTGPGSGPS